MRSKHAATLRRVYEVPKPSGIRWRDIEAMLRAYGVDITERSGSRVALEKAGRRLVVHRPHPSPETSRAAVRDIAKFLLAAGVKVEQMQERDE